MEHASYNGLDALCHDLRTFLSVFKGAVALLDTPSIDAAMVRRASGALAASTAAMDALVEQVLTPSFVVQKVRTDLSTFFDKWCATATPYAMQRDVQLLISVESGLVLCTDPLLLARCLTNLFVNAMTATNPHGTISVSVTRQGTFVHIEMADNGIGLPPARVEDPFDRTAKMPQSRGLRLVEQIVQALGGRIECLSTAGKGCTFTLFLPMVQP